MHHVIYAFCAILLASFLVGCGEDKAPPTGPRPVLSAVASSVDSDVVREFPGQISAIQEVELAFEVPGRVTELLVKPGDDVAADQPLARLDKENYLITRERAEGELRAVEATLAQAEAAFTRAKTLIEGRAMSQADFDKAEALVETSRAQLQSAQASLDQAQKNIRNTVLRAPYAGIVAERMVDEFSEVQASQPIFIIQARDRLRVSIDVPESFVLSMEGSIEERRRTAETAKTQMYFTGYPDRIFDLTFDEVATAPDPETLTWSVRFEMPVPPDIIVLPGMSCYVRTFNHGRRYSQAGIRIPLSALTQGSESGTGAVWVVDPAAKTVSKRNVSFGDIRDHSVSITEGLSEGDIVVRAGVSDLVDGKQVRLLEGR